MFPSRSGLREGDILSPCEPPSGGLIDGPGQVGGREDQDATRVPKGGGSRFFACGGAREIAPLNQEFGFYAARGFVLAAAAGRQEGVDLVDEDYARRELFGEEEERADEFFAFAELFARELVWGK